MPTFGSFTFNMDQNCVLNDQYIVSHSSRIHLELPPPEGVADLPYAEILNPMGEHFAEASVRADTAVRPYAEDLDRVASFEIHPGTKKRRMLSIVVSRLQVVFQRLILLDYQIGLDFASGTRSVCGDRITNRATHPNRTVHLHD